MTAFIGLQYVIDYNFTAHLLAQIKSTLHQYVMSTIPAWLFSPRKLLEWSLLKVRSVLEMISMSGLLVNSEGLMDF